MTLRTFSYGGGVQSTAALVLAAQGKIDFPIFLFSNVGNDSERDETLKYVYEVAIPYAEEHGIRLHQLQKRMKRGPRKGEIETIYSRIMRPGGRSQVIPVYLSGSGMPGNRSCTADFKIGVIAGVQKELGATAEEPAITGLGISIDEYQRIRTDSGVAWQRLEYPLIDLRLTRTDCESIIRSAGLPVPLKSACWFCPYQSIASWHHLKREEPDLFERAVAMERHMNVLAAERNDAVYLTRKLRPLDQVVGDQADMFNDLDDACESGFCMT